MTGLNGNAGGSRAWGAVACLLALLLVAEVGGCSGKTAKKKSADGAAEKMPPIDMSTAFAVDDGRIAAASPTGWKRLPRSKDCLVKYQPGLKKSYPKILITAAPAPEGCAEITPENHDDFAAGIAAGVEEALGKSKPLKKPAAVKLGDHLGVAWGVPGSINVDGIKESVERWSYAVVIGGRLYTVEARAPKGKMDEAGKAAAKAMAAALAPPSAGTVEEQAGTEEKPAGEASPLDALGSLPAEEKPAAEDKPAEDAGK